MFREIAKALFIPFAISIISFLGAELFSFSAAFYLGFLALLIYCMIQAWYASYLLSNLQKDDLIGKKRGLGIWREIYYQLEKKSKFGDNKSFNRKSNIINLFKQFRHHQMA